MSSRRGARPQIKSHTNPRKAQRMWVFGNRISRIDTCVTRPYSSLSQIQKSRPVDSRVCFLYARFIYKTKRLIAPQHNRLIVFNSSFQSCTETSVFSPVNPIYLAWEYDALRDARRAVVTSFLLLVNSLSSGTETCCMVP